MIPSPCIRPEVIPTATLGLGFEDKKNRIQGQGSQGTTEVGVYRRGKKEVIQLGSNWRARGKEDMAGLKIAREGWPEADATRL